MSAALAATVWVDRSPSPALAVDSEGRITAANDGIARCLTATPRELLATELIAWAADPEALRDFLHNGAETSAEFRLLAADGDERWVEISIGKQSVAGATLLSVFDVTVRHIEHDKLEEETRRYRDIIGVGGGTLYEVNADLNQIRMWERDTASGRVQIRERRARFPDDVIDPTFNQEGLAETRQRYAAREPVRNLIYRVPGNEVYRLGNSVPFYDNNGIYRGCRGVSIDVTAQVLAERQRDELERQLRHSQKLEALGTLAGGVAHDLNNALVPILTLSKLALADLPEDSPMRGDIEIIISASEHARDLVKQIVAFSRKQDLVRQELDVAVVTREALRMLRASLPATIQIVENISEVPPVFGDPGGLQQVVVNLVTNAAQAIDGGIGRITVSVLGISETASAPHRGRTGPKAYYDDGERFHEVDPRTLAGVTRR